jgi:hypothetical protein
MPKEIDDSGIVRLEAQRLRVRVNPVSTQLALTGAQNPFKGHLVLSECYDN